MMWLMSLYWYPSGRVSLTLDWQVQPTLALAPSLLARSLGVLDRSDSLSLVLDNLINFPKS